jgi:predicted ATPase
MRHIARVTLHAERFPTREHYPFSLPVLQQTPAIDFRAPVTFFLGENGTGKSTLLEAIAHRCHIHIWRGPGRSRVEHNPYEQMLHRFISVQWTDTVVPGSFFAGEIFRHFVELLDDIASTDPGQLKYFGGKSLASQSHGEGLMAFFKSRYRLKGLYLLDEPETALSPKRQVELLKLLLAMSRAGHAQFIVATHSPILLACPQAEICSFDDVPVAKVPYDETAHYRLYRRFMAHPEEFLEP